MIILCPSFFFKNCNLLQIVIQSLALGQRLKAYECRDRHIFFHLKVNFPIQDISREEDKIFMFSLDQNVNFCPQKESRVIHSTDFENLDVLHTTAHNQHE